MEEGFFLVIVLPQRRFISVLKPAGSIIVRFLHKSQERSTTHEDHRYQWRFSGKLGGPLI
jgi:hypothetical protein